MRQMPCILVGAAFFGMGALSMWLLDKMPPKRVLISDSPYSYNYDSGLGIAAMLATSHPESRLVYWHNDTKSSGLLSVLLIRLESDEDGETYALCDGLATIGNVELQIDGRDFDLTRRCHRPGEV